MGQEAIPPPPTPTFNKQLLDEVFVISNENNQGRGRGYQLKKKVEAAKTNEKLRKQMKNKNVYES